MDSTPATDAQSSDVRPHAAPGRCRRPAVAGSSACCRSVSSCPASTCSSSTSRSPTSATTTAAPASSSLSWVLNGYTIVFAAILVPAGRWADRVGRRRVFGAGLVAFTLGSALCGVAPGVAALIAARVIQAVGAGMMVPDLAVPAARRRPARGPRRAPSAPGRPSARWRRARPGHRRLPRPGQLALGVLDQHPVGLRGRAARRPRSFPRAATRTAAAPTRRHRAPALLAARRRAGRAGAGEGTGLGLGVGTVHRPARRRRWPRRAVVVLRSARHHVARHRAVDCCGPVVQRRLRRLDPLLRRLRRLRAQLRRVPDRRVALLGRPGRPRHRPGTADGPAVRPVRRPATGGRLGGAGRVAVIGCLVNAGSQLLWLHADAGRIRPTSPTCCPLSSSAGSGSG